MIKLQRNIVATVLFLISAIFTQAATHTWSGAVNGYWSNAGNWSSGGVPAVGEAAPLVLSFPKTATRFTVTNDIGSLFFGDLSLDELKVTGNGYAFYGKGGGTNLAFTGYFDLFGGITDNISCTGTNVTFDSSLEFYLPVTNGIYVGTGATLSIGSWITGPGGIIKEGQGTATLSGVVNNTYLGQTLVYGGTLRLDCGFVSLVPFPHFVPQAGVPGAVQIGGVSSCILQLAVNNQLNTVNSLLIGTNGLLDLNSFSTTCGPITLNGGSAQTSGGTLTLANNVANLTGTVGQLFGTISLGGNTRTFDVGYNGFLSAYVQIVDGGASAGITKTGLGGFHLANDSLYTGPTHIVGGYLNASSSGALGAGPGGVTVDYGAQLNLVGFTVFLTALFSNQSLTISGAGPNNDGALAVDNTVTWQGPIVLAADSYVKVVNDVSHPFTITGPISGPGEFWLDGTGTTVFAGSSDNTFLGPLILTGTNILWLQKSSGAAAVPGSLFIGNASDNFSSALVQLQAANQIANSSLVTVNKSGELDLNNFNDAIGGLAITDGTVSSGNGVLTLLGDVSVGPGNYWASIYGWLSLGGQTRAINSTGSLQILGNIIDGGASAGLTKNGSGYLSLMGSNSYSGLTLVNSGYMFVDNNYALGSTAQGTVVSNAANLYLDGFQIANESLTLATSGWLESEGTNIWTGPINIATSATIDAYNPTDWLTLSGAISGNASVAFTGSGTVLLSGSQDNTYSGTSTAEGRLLLLQKSAGHIAIPGNVIIGDSSAPPPTHEVRLLADNQINGGVVGYVQVLNSGFLNLNGHQQSALQLYLSDNATVDSAATGLLTLKGNVTADSPGGGYPTILGQLSLGGSTRTFSAPFPAELYLDANVSDGGSAAGLNLTGGGTFNLKGSNSFTGTVIANTCQIWLNNNFALGATNGGTFVTNGATLSFGGVNITNEALTIGGAGWLGGGAIYVLNTNSWSGPIQLANDFGITENWTDSVLTASGPISGPAGFTASGAGTLRLAGNANNTFAGTVTNYLNRLELAKSNSIAIPSRLVIGTTYSAADSQVAKWFGTNQIADGATVVVQKGGLLDLNNFIETIGDLSGVGHVNLGNGILAAGGTNSVDTFSGPITGAGGEFDKIGTNTLVLGGINTYTSGTMVKGGTLLVNGQQNSSDVYVYAGATLGGNGSVGPIHSTGGTISPGNSPGQLTVNGNAILDATSKFIVELNGTSPGVSYDQLNDIGQLAANDATLQVLMSFSGAISNQYVIVNHPTGLTSTIFAGLSEGDIVTANNGANFKISYVGGDGNDVVLTQTTVPAAPQLNAITRLGNGNMLLDGTGTPNLIYHVQANTNLCTTNWIVIGPTTASGLGAISFTDSQTGAYVARFYRLTYP